jgi:hypothetical protein
MPVPCRLCSTAASGRWACPYNRPAQIAGCVEDRDACGLGYVQKLLVFLVQKLGVIGVLTVDGVTSPHYKGRGELLRSGKYLFWNRSLTVSGLAGRLSAATRKVNCCGLEGVERLPVFGNGGSSGIWL